MKRVNSLFTIGTIGIIVTAILHILATLFLKAGILQIAFLILYTIFILFLTVGFKKIIEEKNMF